MKMGVSCKTLHIKSALYSPRVYVIPKVTSQIGKQCKPVQVHSFSRFYLWVNLRKWLVGEASPIPFERYLRYRLHDFQSFCKNQNFSFLSLQKKVMTAATSSGAHPLSVKSLQSSLSYLQLTGAWHVPVISPKEKLAIGNSAEHHAHPDNADGLILVLPG